ncbi:hypothetical protein [Streptomyces scabiei]|uniref:hypothetical protein n=1 Tax=Streptomyces scabiei TaxID=1930 RepID=UPI001F449061|nr:hypothetical protein [Streptomyces scabiei]
MTILAFIAVAMKLGSAYGWNVDQTEQAAIMVVLSCVVAVAQALILKTGAAFAAIVNLGQAAIALFMAFGLEMSATDQALWMAGIETFLALFVRREVTAPIASLKLEQSSLVRAA